MTTQEKLTKIESVIREVCDIKYAHEIHLENILRAIESKDPGEWLVRPDGDIYRDMNPYASKAHIDLTLPLHLQSDEFISWLYGVLVIE